MMKNLVAISEFECSLVSGGRNESIAAFIETVAQCAGSLARLIYLFVNRGCKHIAILSANGYYDK